MKAKACVPWWITWLPVGLCLLLTVIGMALVTAQWAHTVGETSGRPDHVAGPAPQDALAFSCIQLLSAVLLVASGRISRQEREGGPGDGGRGHSGDFSSGAGCSAGRDRTTSVPACRWPCSSG